MWTACHCNFSVWAYLLYYIFIFAINHVCHEDIQCTRLVTSFTYLRCYSTVAQKSILALHNSFSRMQRFWTASWRGNYGSPPPRCSHCTRWLQVRYSPAPYIWGGTAQWCRNRCCRTRRSAPAPSRGCRGLWTAPWRGSRGSPPPRFPACAARPCPRHCTLARLAGRCATSKIIIIISLWKSTAACVKSTYKWSQKMSSNTVL